VHWEESMESTKFVSHSKQMQFPVDVYDWFLQLVMVWQGVYAFPQAYF